LALVSFVVLAVAPFAVAATRASFWRPEHSTAPVATAVYLTVMLALVVGRYRWAWVLLVLFDGAALLGWAFDADRLVPTRAVWYCLILGTLLLLLSAPMRGRLRRPVSLPRRVHDPTP
jgi:hypothetical protein